MKSFRNIVTEVAQPKGEDEINFKAKHEIELIDEPNAEESQFEGGTKKTKPRKADYVDGEDEAVYESHFIESLDEGRTMKTGFIKEVSSSLLMRAANKADQKAQDHHSKSRAFDRRAVDMDPIDTDAAEKLSKKSDVHYHASNKNMNRGIKFRAAAAAAALTENGIKGWKHANRDVAKARSAKAAESHTATLHSLKNYVSAAVKSAARSRQAMVGLAKSKVQEDTDLEEAVGPKRKLDKANIVHSHHPAAVQFAKEYHAAHAGDYRSGGPQGKDEANSEKFHATYDSKHTRHGFGGSGTTVYKHKQTGHEYEVDRVPNGKGFYGTDHHVDIHSSKHEDISENLDEAAAFASGTVKFGDGKTGNVKEQDASILNTLYAKLKKEGAGSHEEMHKHAMENQKNFAAVVEFAIETVGK